MVFKILNDRNKNWLTVSFADYWMLCSTLKVHHACHCLKTTDKLKPQTQAELALKVAECWTTLFIAPQSSVVGLSGWLAAQKFGMVPSNPVPSVHSQVEWSTALATRPVQ